MARGGPAAEVVVEIRGAGRGALAHPAFAAGEDIRMSAATLGDARVGDLARVVVRGRSARVVDVFGRAHAPGPAMAGFLWANGRGTGAPRVVEREVAAMVEGDPLADPGRRDLTAQDVVTIDPEGAKDHDDAIAAELDGDNVRLWVHIADVGWYVQPGTAVDRDAAHRGCSLYVPGTVDPMLPARLSSDLCSLRPGVPRRVISVEMTVTPEGEVWTRASSVRRSPPSGGSPTRRSTRTFTGPLWAPRGSSTRSPRRGSPPGGCAPAGPRAGRWRSAPASRSGCSGPTASRASGSSTRPPHTDSLRTA
jgi:hypothetical protein